MYVLSIKNIHLLEKKKKSVSVNLGDVLGKHTSDHRLAAKQQVEPSLMLEVGFISIDIIIE